MKGSARENKLAGERQGKSKALPVRGIVAVPFDGHDGNGQVFKKAAARPFITIEGTKKNIAQNDQNVWFLHQNSGF